MSAISELSGQEAVKRYNVDASNIKLSELIGKISQESGIRFAFNPKELPVDTIITASYRDKTIEEILSDLSRYNVSYKIARNHIILRKKVFVAQNAVVDNLRSCVITGYVRDRSTGEALIGSAIYIPETGQGTMTNGYGFFSLRANEGKTKIRISFLGYISEEWDMEIKGDTVINFRLGEAISRIEDIIIISGFTQRNSERMMVAGSELPPEAVKNMSGLFGEPDVIKSLQSLPGINFYSDGSTIFHVRGGDRDQNIILVDEAPVYNPAHLLGLFSVFTPGAINKIDVYKSEMPAKFGGRLSSVIDVKLKEGNSHDFSFSGSTGLVATTLTLEGPVNDENSSFLLSARQSHLLWMVNRVTTVEELRFTDFNLKFNVKPGTKDRIFFSLYTGLDKFRNRENATRTGGLGWVNTAGNIRWNHIFGKSIFANTSLLFSNYDYNLFTNYESNERWNTGISLFGLKSDVSYYLRPDLVLNGGISVANHHYSPGNFFVGNNTSPVTRGVSPRDALETALYGELKRELTENVSLRLGMRLTSWNNVGPATEYLYDIDGNPLDTLFFSSRKKYNSFLVLDPRLGITFSLSERSAFKASIAVNSQFEHLLSNSTSPFTSLEVWLPSGPNIKPKRAWQIAGGYFFTGSDNRFSVDIEGFHKIMTNYMEYVDHAYMLFNPHVETELLYGRGRSFGAEINLRKNYGKFTGWVNYTISRTTLRTNGINGGRSYPARYDRPHNLGININYEINPAWRLVANWSYSTGVPFTTPTGYFTYYGYQVPVYQTRNNSRLPDYHRLDLATEIKLNRKPRRYEHYLNISVLNLYARKNPFSVNFNKIINEDGVLSVPTDRSELPLYQPTQSYIYGLIPSFSYQFRFR